MPDAVKTPLFAIGVLYFIAHVPGACPCGTLRVKHWLGILRKLFQLCIAANDLKNRKGQLCFRHLLESCRSCYARRNARYCELGIPAAKRNNPNDRGMPWIGLHDEQGTSRAVSHNRESAESRPGYEPRWSVFSENRLACVKVRRRGLKNIHDRHPGQDTFRSGRPRELFPPGRPAVGVADRLNSGA